jgi:hypothetical protein
MLAQCESEVGEIRRALVVEVRVALGTGKKAEGAGYRTMRALGALEGLTRAGVVRFTPGELGDVSSLGADAAFYWRTREVMLAHEAAHGLTSRDARRFCAAARRNIVAFE